MLNVLSPRSKPGQTPTQSAGLPRCANEPAETLFSLIINVISSHHLMYPMFSSAVVHPCLLDGDPIDPITLIGETALDPGELLKVAVQEHLVPALEPDSAESIISILQEKRRRFLVKIEIQAVNVL